LLLVLIAVALILGYLAFMPKTMFSSNANVYQAVLLDNGQAYFGKLSRQDSDFFALREVYYLQVPQSISGTAGSERPQLIKLGGEIQGPEDLIRMNKEHIVYIEDLRSDSPVTQAINNFKQQK
jgi:hypothetical protein